MKRFYLLLAFSILISAYSYAQAPSQPAPHKPAPTEKGIKPGNGKSANGRPDFQGILQLKRNYIQENLTLPEAKAPKFWALYDQYINEEKKIHTAFLNTLKIKKITREMLYEENKLTDEQLSFVMEQKLNCKEKIFFLEKKFYNQAKNILSPRELAKFYKLEHRFKDHCKQFNHKDCQHHGKKKTMQVSPEQQKHPQSGHGHPQGQGNPKMH